MAAGLVGILDWAVIGAGPAGIAAVGKLIDAGIEAKKIAWIDPYFQCGDFARLWHQVPSNTKVGLFRRYLREAKAFDYPIQTNFTLEKLADEENCLLEVIAKPLQSVSNQLKNKVHALQDTAKQLTRDQSSWHVHTPKTVIGAKQVIVAIGAEPKQLNHSNIKRLTLDVALNPEKLMANCNQQDCVAVFGSSHSAILAMRNLVTCGVNKIINFYQSPLKYAVYLDDFILFDDTGLKGSTAAWAKTHLNQTNEKLLQVYSNPENISQYLPKCNKVVYAIGFEKRNSLTIQGMPTIHYNHHTGIIAPGLFGLGIAFPQANIDKFGNREYRVGLWKFIDYVNQVLPIWMRYPI